jgi:ribosomal protein S18 acetylase RimI-like enzyme
MSQRDFRLREFSTNDLEECVVFFRQMCDYHREIYEDDTIPYDDEYIRKKLQRTDDNYIKIVAEKDKRIIGLLTIDIKGTTCQLDEILVDKAMRGKGIGTALAEFLKKTAVERGCDEIQVSFAARNLRALNFYYKEVGLSCLGMIQIFMPLTERGREQWYKKGKKTVFLGLDFYY